jgi:hypothetical protein
MSTQDESNKINGYYGGRIDNIMSGDHFTSAYFDDMKKGIRREVPLEEVILTKYDTLSGKFHIRLNFSTQYIEIPISLSRINEWKNEIDKLNKLYMEEEKEDALEE